MRRNLSFICALILVVVGFAMVMKGVGKSATPSCKPGFVLMQGYGGRPVCVLGLPPVEPSNG